MATLCLAFVRERQTGSEEMTSTVPFVPTVRDMLHNGCAQRLWAVLACCMNAESHPYQEEPLFACRPYVNYLCIRFCFAVGVSMIGAMSLYFFKYFLQARTAAVVTSTHRLQI